MKLSTPLYIQFILIEDLCIAAKPSETTTTSPSIQGYKQDRRKLPEPILAKNSIEYELLMLELQTEYKKYAKD